MDRLPEQHIESLTDRTRDDAYAKIERLLSLRQEGTKPEEQIATKLGFGSAMGMHRQLESWGLHGLLPPGHKTEALQERRPVRGGEPGVELPPLADAATLFREALGELLAEVSELEHWQETYDKSGRFHATHKAPVSFVLPPSRPECMSEEQWRSLAEQVGEVDETEGLVVPDATFVSPKGATRKPQGIQVALIAAYVLADRPLKPLVKALNLEPDDADIEAIEDLVSKGDRSLRHVAEELARAVRHSKTPRGKPPKELSPAEQQRLEESAKKGGA